MVMPRKTLLVPDFSAASVVMAFSLLDQDSSGAVDGLRTFIPAFDLTEQITNRTKVIQPKKYKHIDLDNLEESLGAKELVKTIRNAKNYNVENNSRCVNIKNISYKIFSFFNKLLPSKIIKNQLVSSIYTKIGHYFNIIGILLTPIEMGPNRIALLFRAKNLAEEKIDYEKKIGNYAALVVNQSNSPNLDQSYKEMIEREKISLDRWKIKIDLDNRALKMDYFKYLMEISKYIFSNLALIISFSPLKSFIDIAAIVQKLPGLMELIDYGLSSLSLHQMVEKVRVFNDWETNYRSKKIMFQSNNLSKKSGRQLIKVAEDKSLKDIDSWVKLKRFFESNKEDRVEKLDSVINSSGSLLEKRLAIRDKKLVELGASANGRLKVDRFLLRLKQGMNEREFEIWHAKQTPLSLLTFYVDHQETLEIATKNAINHMISKKLELEKKFLLFKNTQTNFSYWYSAISLSISIILGITNVIVGPTIPASILFYCLTGSSVVITLSFWLANSILSSRYKSHTSGMLNFRIGWRQLKYEVSNYWLKVKEKELSEKNPNFLRVAKSQFKQSIIGIAQKEMEDYLKLEGKTADLLLETETLKEERRENEISDFDKFAKLDTSSTFYNVSNNAISALIDAFKEIDFSLNISAELKDLIQVELGIDINKLQAELNKENQEHALRILKKDLVAFFTLDEAAYTTFMKYQKAHLEPV